MFVLHTHGQKEGILSQKLAFYFGHGNAQEEYAMIKSETVKYTKVNSV